LTRGSKQEAIMQQVMREPGIEKNWESEDIEQKILAMLH
jgi:hypothetical protein